MNRTAEKLAADLRVLAEELASRIAVISDDTAPETVEITELALRDAIANLRRVRNMLARSASDRRQPQSAP